MKLLLDQNISYKLVKKLQPLYSELEHVKTIGLENAKDSEIWHFARKNNFVIVTFDVDFYELQALKGFPPKIIWLRFGNTTSAELIAFFTKNYSTIQDFVSPEEINIGCLEFRELT